MANIAGKNAKVLSDENDLSAYLNAADFAQDVQPLETTTYGATAKTFIPGIKNATASLKGFWDSSIGAIEAVLSATLGTTIGQIMTIAPEGLTVGMRTKLLSGRVIKYAVSTPVGGVVAVSAEVQADGGIETGFSLHALAVETVTGNGASVDNTALTSNGGVAHLHMTAVTAVSGDSLTVKVQHSVDNITWVDLITFTVITTTTTKERLTVAGTVNRYTRCGWTKGGLGTPSYTFAVGFARR